MTFLEAQDALRLHTEGPQAVRAARCHQGPPHRSRSARGDMDFVTEFADEPDAQQARRCAGHGAAAHAQERERGIAEIDVRQRLQQPAARRAGQVEGGTMTGDVDETAVESPRRIEPEQFAKHGGRPAGGGREIKRVGA